MKALAQVYVLVGMHKLKYSELIDSIRHAVASVGDVLIEESVFKSKADVARALGMSAPRLTELKDVEFPLETKSIRYRIILALQESGDNGLTLTELQEKYDELSSAKGAGDEVDESFLEELAWLTKTQRVSKKKTRYYAAAGSTDFKEDLWRDTVDNLSLKLLAFCDNAVQPALRGALRERPALAYVRRTVFKVADDEGFIRDAGKKIDEAVIAAIREIEASAEQWAAKGSKLVAADLTRGFGLDKTAAEAAERR